MYFATTVNKPFTERVAEARPLSHLAAATLLGTSIFMVHSGAETALHDAPQLVAATTAAIIGIEWLQWTALGRIAKLERANEHTRAGVLKLSSLGIGVFQVILYTIAVVGYAAKSGASWGEGWPLFGAIAIATLFAAISFVTKWTSCDNVDAPAAATHAGPTGGTRAPIDDAIFGREPAKPATVTQLKQRIARTAEDRPFRPARAAGPASNAGRDLAMKRWKTA